MDDARISQLTDGGILSGDEIIPITQKTGPFRILKTVGVHPSALVDYFTRTVEIFPPGCIMTYAASVTALEDQPRGWLVCDGRSVNRSTYPNLFNAIKTTYGSTSPTTFKLPDLRGRVIMGYNTTSSTHTPAFGNWPAGTSTTFAQTSGEFFHRLSVDEMPSHSHDVIDPGHTHSMIVENFSNVGTASNTDRGGGARITRRGQLPVTTTGVSVASAGGSLMHNNMQPYICLNYIIKY